MELADLFTLEDKRVSLGEGLVDEDGIRGEKGGGAEGSNEVRLTYDVLVKQGDKRLDFLARRSDPCLVLDGNDVGGVIDIQ